MDASTQNTLYRYNPWWEKGYAFSELISRENILVSVLKTVKSKDVVFITGLRRIGKTSLMRLVIRHLIEQENLAPSRCLYASMDDYALIKHSISDILDEFRAIHKLRFNERVYLFLDEITHKKDFEIQLKNIYDSQNVKIFASSSGASLLKPRKAYLTGRSRIFEVLPLDFKEYLLFKNISLKKADNHLLPVYFEEFLKTGGVPEFVLREEPEYLQELVDDIIYKDIAAINGIKNVQQLKDYFLLLMERSGKAISINKIANILGISVDTSRRYLELFSDTYLIYLMSRHGKTNTRLLSPKKIYACDTGIRTMFTGFRDKGSLFENYVYLNIRHLQPEYIYENNTELDFFTSNKWLIEAKYHKEELNENQQNLFNSFKAKKKMVIRNQNDIDDLGG